MKKKIFLLCFILYASTLFAESIEGLYGVKFGSDKEEIERVLTYSKGLKEVKETGLRSNYHLYSGNDITYASFPVSSIMINCLHNCFISAEIFLKGSFSDSEIYEVINVLISKYNLSDITDPSQNSYRDYFYTRSYKSTDGFKLEVTTPFREESKKEYSIRISNINITREHEYGEKYKEDRILSDL